jgi:hypothetical protein
MRSENRVILQYVIQQGTLRCKNSSFQIKEVLDAVTLRVDCIRRNGLKHWQFQHFPEKLVPDYEEDIWYLAVQWLNTVIYDRQ